MVAKLGNRDDPLPQDSFEGVDEEEWVRAVLGGLHSCWWGGGSLATASFYKPREIRLFSLALT